MSPELQMQTDRRKNTELSLWSKKDGKEADKFKALDIAALRELGEAETLETFRCCMFWKPSILVPKPLIETNFFAANYIVRNAAGTEICASLVL